MRQRTRLANLEERISTLHSEQVVSWIIKRADGSALLRMADGTQTEADPDHLPNVKAYTEETDPDRWTDDQGKPAQ